MNILSIFPYDQLLVIAITSKLLNFFEKFNFLIDLFHFRSNFFELINSQRHSNYSLAEMLGEKQMIFNYRSTDRKLSSDQECLKILVGCVIKMRRY